MTVKITNDETRDITWIFKPGCDACDYERDFKRFVSIKLHTCFKPVQIQTDPAGGKSTRLTERYDLLPPAGLEAAARAMKAGESYAGTTGFWTNLLLTTNLNHAMFHIVQYLKGDRQEEHLGHAAARMLMAAAQETTK